MIFAGEDLISVDCENWCSKNNNNQFLLNDFVITRKLTIENQDRQAVKELTTWETTASKTCDIFIQKLIIRLIK